MKKKLIYGEKYEIIWIDVDHNPDWISFDELQDKIYEAEQPIKNIYYFVCETKQSYVFTAGLDVVNKKYFDLNVFPKGMILKIKKIK